MLFNESSTGFPMHSCYDSTSTWLKIYSIHIYCNACIVNVFIYLLAFFVRLILAFRPRLNNLREFHDAHWHITQSHHYQLLQFVVQQIVLTIVYVVAAFIWASITGAAPATSMALSRWRIEASVSIFDRHTSALHFASWWWSVLWISLT